MVYQKHCEMPFFLFELTGLCTVHKFEDTPSHLEDNTRYAHRFLSACSIQWEARLDIASKQRMRQELWWDGEVSIWRRTTEYHSPQDGFGLRSVATKSFISYQRCYCLRRNEERRVFKIQPFDLYTKRPVHCSIIRSRPLAHCMHTVT